jgi:hypothetical protein
MRNLKVVPLPDLAFNLQLAFVTLERAIHHSQAHTGSPFFFGGEERLHSALEHLISHPSPGVGYLQNHFLTILEGFQNYRATFGHGVDCIEN